MMTSSRAGDRSLSARRISVSAAFPEPTRKQCLAPKWLLSSASNAVQRRLPLEHRAEPGGELTPAHGGGRRRKSPAYSHDRSVERYRLMCLRMRGPRTLVRGTGSLLHRRAASLKRSDGDSCAAVAEPSAEITYQCSGAGWAPHCSLNL